MKANVLHAIGDLRYEEVPTPQMGAGEVLVAVRACGICGSDVPRVFENGTYHFPTIIGHEFAGEVVAAGDEASKAMVGKRVSVFPLIPCRECDCCERGDYEMCHHYNYLGSRCDGAFAEYVVAPVWNLCPLPDEVALEEGAMMEPAAVAVHALKRSGMKLGDTVVVFGPGTIGMIMAQVARAAGAAQVVLVGRSENKLQFARENVGVELTCNSQTDDVVKYVNDLTAGRGADVVIEGTGGQSTLNLCFDVTRHNGNIVALGNPHDDVHLDKTSYWKLLRRQLHLHGTWNSSFGFTRNDWTDVVDLLAQKRLSLSPLITHRLPLDQLNEGLRLMRDRNVYTNKVMIINPA